MGLQTFPETVTTLTWRSAVKCSTARKRRPQKLDRRWLKDGCVERLAIMMK